MMIDKRSDILCSANEGEWWGKGTFAVQKRVRAICWKETIKKKKIAPTVVSL